MARRVGDVLVVDPVEVDAVAPCELCGVVAELRPYGPGGKMICLGCWEEDPEGRSRMLAILEEQLRGATSVVGPNGEVLRRSRAEDLLTSRERKN